jgi:hypothetical protein
VPDKLEQLNARLGQLVSEIMKETDPVRYDELGDEIWTVLRDRESFMKQNPESVTARCDACRSPAVLIDLASAAVLTWQRESGGGSYEDILGQFIGDRYGNDGRCRC